MSIIKPALCAALILALAGCDDATKKTFGLEANPPDAFQVGTEAPLSLPPELGQMTPPNPGQPRPQQIDAATDAANGLVAANALAPTPSNLSPGAAALLQQAGPTPPADIREQVNQNALVASKPPGFIANVLGNGPAPPPAVDAAAEQKRIQQNEALGQPVTTGTTPVAPHDKPGFLHDFFSNF